MLARTIWSTAKDRDSLVTRLCLPRFTSRSSPLSLYLWMKTHVSRWQDEVFCAWFLPRVSFQRLFNEHTKTNETFFFSFDYRLKIKIIVCAIQHTHMVIIFRSSTLLRRISSFIESRKWNQTHEKRRKKKRPKKKDEGKTLGIADRRGVRARQRRSCWKLAINTRSRCRQFISSLKHIVQSVTQIYLSTKKTL